MAAHFSKEVGATGCEKIMTAKEVKKMHTKKSEHFSSSLYE